MEDKYNYYGGREKYLERTKSAWTRASGFPPDKEVVYPEHVIAQEFDKYSDKLVLEYACGLGSDARSYLKRGNYVVLCDIVPQNIEAAKKHVGSLAENATFYVLEDSHIIPVDDNQFDVVNAHGVIMHIVDPVPVLESLARVLHPEGIMYVMLYTEFLWDRAQEYMQQAMKDNNIDEYEAFCWFTDAPGAPYARYYTVEEAEELFNKVGLKIESHYLYNNNDFRTFRLRKK